MITSILLAATLAMAEPPKNKSEEMVRKLPQLNTWLQKNNKPKKKK